ncbi:MAG: class IV adenylate cyclase [Phycisphaerae bacterium]|nr:class IV adenylate cyclase [Phycisphaerae bacterium]MDW8261098.1 class IV adenylate cyclase [Phycisphaerales bacterium]
MPIELEAKVRVSDFNEIRSRLQALGAARKGVRLETNTYFDTPQHTLLSRDSGLRLRVVQPIEEDRVTQNSPAPPVITFKGPQMGTGLKQRQEIEVQVHDPTAAIELLAQLGFAVQLSFQKRRESWSLPGGCVVELDELPILGRFVEVEGPSRQAVLELLDRLGLASGELITTSYIAMLSEHLRGSPVHDRFIRL